MRLLLKTHTKKPWYVTWACDTEVTNTKYHYPAGSCRGWAGRDSHQGLLPCGFFEILCSEFHDCFNSFFFVNMPHCTLHNALLIAKSAIRLFAAVTRSAFRLCRGHDSKVLLLRALVALLRSLASLPSLISFAKGGRIARPPVQ